MLRRAEHKLRGERVTFRIADALHLPFDDGQFDVVTIAFALRNLNTTADHFSAALRECRRVLRPGGRLVTVETTQPPGRPAQWVLRGYARWVVPLVGALISRHRPAYAYLSSTIPRFHGAPALAQIMRAAGFAEARFTYLTFGLVAVHEAWKA
jgi:demethylmenaquinone methyltransferase / 2-methoxy-6-polyprenyl-1,4-benzoquinol methylase